jgi:hypothetical protein
MPAKRMRWVHVDTDGRERRWSAEPPYIPTLTVELVDAFTERTWTKNKDGKSVTPPGVGWQLEGKIREENSTTWVRPRR